MLYCKILFWMVYVNIYIYIYIYICINRYVVLAHWDFFKVEYGNANWRVSKCVNLWESTSKINTISDSGVEFYILKRCECQIFFVSNAYLKSDNCETCFRHSAKGTMTAWDLRYIMFLYKSWLFIWTCHWSLDFHDLSPFCVFSIK